jgi:hypothetical protein
MLALLDSYFYIWAPILFGIAAVHAVLSHVRGRRIDDEFGVRSNVRVRFRERGASGKRTKPFTPGGASRVLDVVVTDRELWIRGIWPIFTYIGKQTGLTHRVPLTSLGPVVTHGNRVELRFNDASGSECQLELQLKNPRAFVSAVVPSA